MTTAAPVTLKGVLTLRNLVMFGLAYLAPTVVFDYYGIVTGLTGGTMALAYVVTLVAIFFTAYSYALMVKASPSRVRPTPTCDARAAARPHRRGRAE